MCMINRHLLGVRSRLEVAALSSTIPEMQKGDADLVRPSQASPYSFEPTAVATAGAMRCARMAWAQCGNLSVGRSENLCLVAHIVRGTMLGIVRANETTSRWFIVMFILPGIGVLTFRRRLLIRNTFGGFVLGALGDRGE